MGMVWILTYLLCLRRFHLGFCLLWWNLSLALAYVNSSDLLSFVRIQTSYNNENINFRLWLGIGIRHKEVSWPTIWHWDGKDETLSSHPVSIRIQSTMLALGSRIHMQDLIDVKKHSIDVIGSLFEIASTKLNSSEIGCTDLVYEFSLSFAQN